MRGRHRSWGKVGGGDRSLGKYTWGEGSEVEEWCWKSPVSPQAAERRVGEQHMHTCTKNKAKQMRSVNLLHIKHTCTCTCTVYTCSTS